MATVTLAYDSTLERYVALKLLSKSLATDETFIMRFKREARAVARLTEQAHPNIVQIFDYGFDEASDQHYITMEFVPPAESLADALKTQGRLQLAQGLAVLTDACCGLEHAHQNGIVHRDIKPANLMLTREWRAKLTDFGIARFLSETSTLTHPGTALGTKDYLAPEQCAGGEATPRSDVYALGVVAYRCLGGCLPYEAEGLAELHLKQQTQCPPLLHEVDPSIPKPIAQVVAQALDPEPALRFTSATHMRQALKQASGTHVADENDLDTSTDDLGESTSRTLKLPVFRAVTITGRSVLRNVRLFAEELASSAKAILIALALMFGLAIAFGIIVAAAVDGSRELLVGPLSSSFGALVLLTAAAWLGARRARGQLPVTTDRVLRSIGAFAKAVGHVLLLVAAVPAAAFLGYFLVGVIIGR